jgi:hypothetical protein
MLVKETQIKVVFEGKESCLETWLGADGSFRTSREDAGSWPPEEVSALVENLPHRVYSITMHPKLKPLSADELRALRECLDRNYNPIPDIPLCQLERALAELEYLRSR